MCYERLRDRGLTYSETTKDGQVWCDDNGEKYLLFSTIKTTVQVKWLDTIVKILNGHKITNGIQLYVDSVSASVKNNINNACVSIELICTSDLLCNILRHKYQPQMQKCTVQQAQEALSLYKYSPPRFTSDDAVVRWMNWPRGSVIAICRNKCGNKLTLRGTCCNVCQFRIVH